MVGPSLKSAGNTEPSWIPELVPAAPCGDSETQIFRRSRLRQTVFRCLRLMLAGALILAAGVYFWNSFTQVNSEHAVIAADIISLRTPIEGQLRLANLNPGSEFTEGSLAFRIINPRYGNKEASSQLNWAQEQVERLKSEVDEAAVRLSQCEDVLGYHRRLFERKLIAELEYLNEEVKVTVARAAWSNKVSQLRMAEARRLGIEQQVELQKEADVTMPFRGIVWAVGTRDGAPVSLHETVLQVFDPSRVWVESVFHEKYADRIQVGTLVYIRTVDGKLVWRGRIDAIRGRGSQSVGDKGMNMVPADMLPGRMAVRVKMEKINPFTVREFFGVGRSVIVSLEKP